MNIYFHFPANAGTFALPATKNELVLFQYEHNKIIVFPSTSLHMFPKNLLTRNNHGGIIIIKTNRRSLSIKAVA